MREFQKKYWQRDALNQRRKATHPTVAKFALNKINIIKKYIPIKQDTKLLDVGAGNGFFSYYFDQICHTTAVDYSDKMIALNPIKNKHVMNVYDLKFADNSFDIVFESCLLHHLDQLDNAIKEMSRVSYKYLIFIEPNCHNPLAFIFHALKKEEIRALKLNKKYLEKIFTRNNLKIIASFSQGFIAPNKTPKELASLLNFFDKKLFFLGLDNIIICKKHEKKDS